MVRLRMTVGAGLLLVLMSWVGATQALGAPVVVPRPDQRPWASVVLAPSPGSATLGRKLRVRVRSGTGVTSFRATLGSAVVTRAFHRSGRSRLATLRVGATRGLRFGPNTLEIRTRDRRGRRWVEHVRFVMARSVGGLVRRAAAQPTCGTGARISAGLARAGLSLSVSANGDRRLNVGSSSRERSVNIDADNGLRPGVNVVQVRALDRRAGTYQTRRLRVTMPSTTPVAGAGPSRRTSVGRAVSLDAGRSVAAGAAHRLHYHWTIVKAPRGSRARVLRATRAKPLLRPDRPGRYTLRVTVRQGRAVARRSGGVGRARVLCAANGPSSDVTMVLATVKGGPIGVPVQTITRENGAFGVQVGVPGADDGGSFYPVTTASDALELVVLDRHTLTGPSPGTVTSYDNNAKQAGMLEAAVKALPTGPDAPLVIITKPDATVSEPSDPDAANSITAALNAIGVASVPATVSTGTAACGGPRQCSSFSAIGIPGIPVGQGHLNPGLAGVGSGQAQGGLNGYFQKDLTGTMTRPAGYVFTNTERVSFDTGDPTSDPAVVTVGPGNATGTSPYTSTKLGVPGFFVVILDAGSLALRKQETFTADAGGLTSMDALLTSVIGDPSALVIVRSIGSVARVSNGTTVGPWDAVAGDLQGLGGSQFYLDALNGGSSSHYAQVGPGGQAGTYPSPWTQVSSTEHNVTDPSAPQTYIGRLTGLLARNTSAQFYPDESTPPDTPLGGSLPGIISLPSSPWPDRDTAGDQAALTCITANVNPNGGLQTPIESNYTNQNDVNNWSGWAAALYTSRLNYQALTSPPANCTGFSSTDLTAVRDQLNREWNAVPAVWAFINNMQKALINSQGNASQITTVANDVNASVQASSQVTYDQAAILSDMLWVLSTIPVVNGVADPLNFLAGGLGIVSDLNVGTGGSDQMADVTTFVPQLASTLQSNIQQSIEGLNSVGDMLVSDWTKLQTAAQNAGNTTNASANWSWQTQDYTDAATGLLVGVRRQTYQTLFGSTYDLYRVTPGDVPRSLLADDVTPYQCVTFGAQGDLGELIKIPWQPFSRVQRFGGAAPIVSGEGSFEQWVYAGPDNGFLKTSAATAQLPGESLLANMFTPWTDDNKVSHPPLFNILQFALETYANATTNTQAVTHILKTQTNLNTVSTNLWCQTS